MKEMLRALKALGLTIVAYLLQVCVMRYLQIQGVMGSVVFAALAVLVVSCGKKYAFCASCIMGILMETMVGNVPGLYGIAYPAITMLCAQAFADMSDRQRERRRVMLEGRQALISEGMAAAHWWQALLPRYRDTDLPPFIRIPLCAAAMDALMNVVLISYLYLIGEDVTVHHAARVLGSAAYTAALSYGLMVPCRYWLGMYRKRRKPGGDRL